MSTYRELIEKYDVTRTAVILRDNASCFVCGARNGDIHEIVSRSSWACTDRDMKLCFSAKNRVCLCQRHHREYQGDRDKVRVLLLALAGKHGYEYYEPEFVIYLM